MKKNRKCKRELYGECNLVMPSITISLEMQKTHVDQEHKRYLKANFCTHLTGLLTLEKQPQSCTNQRWFNVVTSNQRRFNVDSKFIAQ